MKCSKGKEKDNLTVTNMQPNYDGNDESVSPATLRRPRFDTNVAVCLNGVGL